MERCDQELLGSYSTQVAREIAFRRNDEFEFSHAPSYHEFQRMLTDWVGLIELPKMKRLEVEKLFGALVIIEKTRKTLAEVIKYRLDANNEGPEEDIGT